MSENAVESEARYPRPRMTEPSRWVTRFAGLVPASGRILDMACGAGRHTRFFLARGHEVTAVDRDVADVADLRETPDVEILAADLEGGSPWPFAGRTFAGIVVTNYLYRPLFPHILASLEDGGVLIYETFARGNQQFGRPRNPDHLLASGELLDLAAGKLLVAAYEHGLVETPRQAIVQRLCAINTDPGAVIPIPPA